MEGNITGLWLTAVSNKIVHLLLKRNVITASKVAKKPAMELQEHETQYHNYHLYTYHKNKQPIQLLPKEHEA